METSITNSPTRVIDMKRRMADIAVSVSWMDFSNRYFGKSSAWFYNKMNGKDGNGGVGGFTPEEAALFKGALCDLADRLRAAADRI